MNDRENYKIIIENIFSQNFELEINENTNNCIGALNHDDNFMIFKTNFIERLKRVFKFYSKDVNTIKKLLDTLKNIGRSKGYQWAGYYSEIVALDYWIQYNNLHNIEYQFIDKGEIFDNSIAKIAGQSQVDLDISLDFSSFKVYMDVKSFKPTHVELADRIFDILKNKIKRDDYLIGIDDIYDVDYIELSNDLQHEIRKGRLVTELEKCIVSGETYYNHKLQSGRDLKVRIAYSKKGKMAMLSTTRIVNPYRLAMNYKYKFIDYYNKLLYNEATFLIFVINPWFNNEISDFCDHNSIFYRSLTRRVFMELIKNNTDVSIFYPKLAGKGLKIKDIVSLISGIVFIEDKSITLTEKDIYNVYFYTNPNAINKKVKRFDFDILRWSHFAKQPTIVEDFEYDNY
jgi:hypothetical protein